VKGLPFALVVFLAAGVSQASGVADRVALAIWGEARGERIEGKRAVASVLHAEAVRIQKLRGTNWEDAIGRACRFPFLSSLQGAGPRRPDLRKPIDARSWAECRTLAEELVRGRFRITVKATNFATITARPYWRKEMKKVAQVGGHVFYSKEDA
jgi:hypothetical protein